MKSLRRLVLFLAAAVCAAAQMDLRTVTSPNGQIEFRLFLSPQQEPSEPLRLAYQVSFRGKLLIDTSFLGLNIRDQPVLGINLGLVKAAQNSVDETYTLPAGKARTIRNHYNSLTAEFMQNGTLGRRLIMEVRAYDDGVAFRYDIPYSQPLQDIFIENDSTQFRFAEDAGAYALLNGQYQRLKLSGMRPESLIGLPFLVEQPGVGWAAVTEADNDHFSGMYLHHLEGRAMEAVLSPRPDDSMLAVTGKPPLASPWRVLLIGADPGRLIESNIVTSLNPPSAIADTSWIKPGKSARSGAGVDTAAIKRSIDLAADSRLEYILIDAGWSVPAIDMPEILRYARSRRVGVWLSAKWDAVEAQMEPAFAQFEKWGVAGVKIDVMNRDDQWMVDFCHRVARAAAAHHLMVNFQGAYKPDGVSRTWPNVLAQEAGIGGFDNLTRAGTRAHQLALYVVFESPLMMVSADQKDFDFIKTVPSSWDETRFVNGRVSEFLTLARKRGADWFLGSITNRDARSVDVPLEFLGAGQWTAEIYSDAVGIEQKRVSGSTVLKLNLASGGGAAVRFVPAK